MPTEAHSTIAGFQSVSKLIKSVSERKTGMAKEMVKDFELCR